MKILSTFIAAIALISLKSAAFELKDGDRVVFYGDSITDQRLYTTFTETYAVTRFPELKVSFVHSGWGGDRVSGGGGGPIDTRLKRDVVAYKPTIMTIMLGMNDASYRAFDEKIFNTYSKGYEHILESVKQDVPGIRFTLIQPSPFDDVTRAPNFEGGYNKVLIRYGEFVKELSEKNHTGLADLNTPIVAALEKAKEINAEGSKKLIADRVHPGAGGQLLMAEALLKAWNAPALVSSVEIDAGSGKVTSAENTKVSDVKTGDTISWKQVDKALPMAVNYADEATALAVKASDFVQALNQEKLTIKNLAAEKYQLSIDGTSVGTFSKAQLADGINLAELQTPMSKQAAEVHKLTLQHNDIHFVRWRQIQVKHEKAPHLEAALKGLDSLEADIVKEQRAMAHPKPHTYELGAAK
jgi:lysophospholipase L1-like esterase